MRICSCNLDKNNRYTFQNYFCILSYLILAHTQKTSLKTQRSLTLVFASPGAAVLRKVAVPDVMAQTVLSSDQVKMYSFLLPSNPGGSLLTRPHSKHSPWLMSRAAKAPSPNVELRTITALQRTCQKLGVMDVILWKHRIIL